MLLDPRIDDALILAARAHANQIRKGTDIPYISHPACVAIILERAGFGVEVVVAGVLHDVVEDCGVSLEEIEQQFGSAVADLVRHASEDKSRSWRDRKQLQIDGVRHAPESLKAVKAADKLHNAHSILRDLESGNDVFARFKATRDETLWYYREVSKAIACGWDHPLAEELRGVVERLISSAESV